jgi:hypothetical protein
MQVIKLKAKLEEFSGKKSKERGSPSLMHCQEPADMMAREHSTT